MRETMFDDSYNIREILDDVIERVSMREKLITTAKQFNEKKREERYTLALRQFENLMQDFLRMYQPVLDRIRAYKDSIHKDIQGLRTQLATVNGMLEASRAIEGLAAKTEQLQGEAQDLEKQIEDRNKMSAKIDDLMSRIQPYLSGSSSMLREPLGDVLSGMGKDLFPDVSDPTKDIVHSSAPKKSRA